MSDRIARIVSILSAAVIGLGAAFLWGWSARDTGAWPDDLVQDGRTIARSLRHFGRIVPTNLLHPAPPRAATTRVAVHAPDGMPDGWCVVMGWDAAADQYAAWLLDSGGTEHHRWPIDYRRLDQDGPSNGSDTPHGMLAMPDGSLILNFDHADAMARLDPCGEPMWIQRGVFHHSLDLADDGTVWTWQGSGTPYAHHHVMLRFDAATGEPLETIDLVADVIRNDRVAELVFGARADFPFRHFDRTPDDPNPHDLFHPNDIEVLDAGLAGAFPDFRAGDLLISLRTLDLVAILDRQTRRPLWWRHGPWVRQHDPDFLPDGTISIYNNNTGRGRSEIVRIDPRTGDLASDLHDGDVRFYSGAMGKHQILPGGQVLIVVPEEGRVVVTTARGDRTWEFNNLVPDLAGVRAHVCHAIWLPPDHFTALPACDVRPD